MVLETLAGIGLAANIIGGASAKKKAAAERFRQERLIGAEAAKAENALLLETAAINDQRKVINDRLLLADQAEEQAREQALVEGPEVSLATPDETLTAQAVSRRRRSFFSQAPSGLTL